MADKKHLNELLASIRAQGFLVTQRASGHYAVFTDLAQTPSEYRGHKNTRARLRRHGWVDPKRPAQKKQKPGE